MIYSFDGGSKETYERMRPGRFEENSFENVYSNIKTFSEIRSKMKASFPRTKIQMIRTDQTFSERDTFYSLFNNYVDDVSVKQYTERGGALSELDDQTRSDLEKALKLRNLPIDTPFFRDKDGSIYIATDRLPCEQPFQRLLVTYDGRVGMCCYDWGAKHPVGYASSRAFDVGNTDYENVLKQANKNAKGFKFLQDIKMPRIYNQPEEKVETLKEIWTGNEIDKVRAAHIKNTACDIEICHQCPFKETYDWQKVN